MNTDHVNRWLTLVANLGVIAGILFLAYEIRQSNRIAVATTEIAVRESYGSGNESVYSNQAVADILHKARDPNADLSGVEREMAEYYMYRQFNTWLAAEKAYENGMADLSTFETAREDMQWTFVTYPALQYVFEENATAYDANQGSEIIKTAYRLVETGGNQID